MSVTVLTAALLAAGHLLAQPALSPFAEAAKKRQERIRSLELTLVRVETVERGGMSQGQGSKDGGKGEQPPERVKIRSRSKLILGEGGVRFENAHPIWSDTSLTWLETTKVSTFNGKLHKMHHPNGLGKGAEPDGFIRGDTNVLETRLHWLLPIMQTYRGFSPMITPYPPSRIKAAGTRALRGKPHSVYESKSGTGMIELLADPEADHLLGQIRRLSKTSLVYQIDITVAAHPRLGQHPAEWELTEYGERGELLRSSRVTVEDIRVNTAPPPETFDITFTPGTLLTDMRTNRYARIKEDGSLVDADPATGAEIAPRMGWWPYLAGGAIALFLSGAIWLYRRRAAHPETQS